MPRKSHRIDFMYVFDKPAPIFGPWAELLHDRLIPVEHFSRYPTNKDMFDVALEWSHCGGQWSIRDKRGAKPDLPDRALRAGRAPIGLVLANRVSKRLRKSIEWLKPTGIPGAWWTPGLEDGGLESGGLLLLDLSALPDVPGMSFLRMLPTPGDKHQAEQRLRALLGDPQLPILTRSRMHEALMNQTITGTDVEQKSAYEIALDRGDARGEVRTLRQAILGVLEVRAILLTSAQRAQLLACDDSAVLHQMHLRAVTTDSAEALFREL